MALSVLKKAHKPEDEQNYPGSHASMKGPDEHEAMWITTLPR